MLDGATMHTWFDTEWDYGFCKGLYATSTAAGYLEGYAPLTMLPAHGPPIADAGPQLASFQQKLRRLEKVMKRGWLVFTAAGDAPQGLSLAAIEITQDGVQRGQLFDVIVDVG